MRRNIIKVTDEIKEGGRNEDTEDFSLLFSPLQNPKHWGVMKQKWKGKNSNHFLFSSQKTTLKCSIQLKFQFPRPFGALLRLGVSHLQFQQRISLTQKYEDRKMWLTQISVIGTVVLFCQYFQTANEFCGNLLIFLSKLIGVEETVFTFREKNKNFFIF